MATPITHIILTDTLYERYFSDCNKEELFLGTILPDIRYIDKDIPKETTHTYTITFDEVMALPTDFEKGVGLHSLVDRIRDDFYISRGIYLFGGDEDFIVALKSLEDRRLYDRVANRNEYISRMDDVPYVQRPDIKKESLSRRYGAIKKSIAQKPNDLSRKTFIADIGLPNEYGDKIISLVNKLSQDEHLLHLIDELYDSIGELIKQ